MRKLILLAIVLIAGTALYVAEAVGYFNRRYL